MAKRKNKALRIAEAMLAAVQAEDKQYEWATMSGRNPFEYGMRTQAEIIGDELVRRKLVPGPKPSDERKRF